MKQCEDQCYPALQSSVVARNSCANFVCVQFTWHGLQYIIGTFTLTLHFCIFFVYCSNTIIVIFATLWRMKIVVTILQRNTISHILTNLRSQVAVVYSCIGNTLACCASGPRFESRCGQKFVFSRKSRKSLRYAALGTGCTLTAVPRSTQPSTLRGTVNEYQPHA